ncbi:MAG: transporter substrate-binding domain-containing protein [Tissierellia bacterium]|nr:transporter substrate-binding domain-containing protein [Tissierellia bacterium]
MKKIKFIAWVLLVLMAFTACSPNAPTEQEEPKTEVEQKDESEVSEKADADNTVEKIKSKGKLVVGTSADYPPYEFTILKDGKDEIVGFDMALARYIADEMGVELEIADMAFESLLIGLETGKFDIVIAGMNPDPERNANFSKTYYNATHGVLINKENEDNIKVLDDLKGKHLGVQIGTIQEGIGEELEDVKLKSLPLITNLILELKTNKIDGVIMEKPVAESYAKVHEDLMVVDDIEWGSDTEGSAVAIKKGNDELTAEIDKIIDKVLEQKLIDQWVIEANELNEGANQ